MSRFIHKGGVYKQARSEQDTKFRKEANSVLRRVVKFLKVDGSKYVITDKKGKYFRFFLGEVASKYRETLVVLGPSANNRIKGELQVAVKPPPGQPRYILILNTLPPELYDQSKWSRLDDLYQHINPSTWMHEFVHLLDYMRRKGPMSTEDGQTVEEQVEEVISRSREDYINEPTEYNAHYQELMHSVEEWINNLSDEDLTKVGNDFELFLEEVEKIDAAHFDFVARLDKRYRRKFIRRLHDRWES